MTRYDDMMTAQKQTKTTPIVPECQYLTPRWPETRFARQNSIIEQISHVISEANEVVLALRNESEDRVFEELGDLDHSLATLWRIAEVERGPGFLQQLEDRIIEKNAARNYYVGK